MDSDLVLLVLLIALSGAFSGAEIALTSLSPAKVQTLKGDKRFGGKAVFRLKQKPEQLLITILIGNNLVNILATVVATLWGVKVFGNNAVGIVTGALTFFILVFGEIMPKTIAQKYADGFSRIMANPLLWLTYIMSPVIWILNLLIHGLMKTLKAKNPMQTLSEEEILAMVDIGTQEGVIEEHEQELIANVLEFTDTYVEEIMTVESDIETIEVSSTIAEAAHFFTEHSHSRFPVYKEDINNIVGIVTVHDVLKLTLSHIPQVAKSLTDLHFTKPIVVPKTKAISALFKEFQRRHQHMAIVVDERGKTIGIVTLEDILEEIVGDIMDEHDHEESQITAIGKSEWEASGEATIEEINEALDVELNYPEHQTISLLILEKLERFPKKGEKVQHENLLIQIKEMHPKKIEKVLITKLPG